MNKDIIVEELDNHFYLNDVDSVNGWTYWNVSCAIDERYNNKKVAEEKWKTLKTDIAKSILAKLDTISEDKIREIVYKFHKEHSTMQGFSMPVDDLITELSQLAKPKSIDRSIVKDTLKDVFNCSIDKDTNQYYFKSEMSYTDFEEVLDTICKEDKDA